MKINYLNILGMIAFLIVIIFAYNFLNSKVISTIDKGGNAGVWVALSLPTIVGMLIIPFQIVSEVIKGFIKSETVRTTIALILTLLLFMLLGMFDYPFKISVIFNYIF